MSASELFNSNTITRDLFGLVVGSFLGSGVSREVYEFTLDESLVVKFEEGSRSFSNVAEWELWREVCKAPKFAKWFAPCVSISPCGTILLQKRCQVFTSVSDPKLPKKIPRHFTDCKISNWGLYKGVPVCLDYGVNLVATYGLTHSLKNPNWYDANK